MAKQRAVNNLCKKVVGNGGQHTVVAFGAARGVHMKGHHPGPVKLVHKALCM